MTHSGRISKSQHSNNQDMKQTLVILFLAIVSTNLFAQTEITKARKPVYIWIYTNDGSIHKGILTGGSATSLQIHPGRIKDYRKQDKAITMNLDYKDITLIKTKKTGGLLKGLLIGGGIGFFPVVFGEGGAYVAILAFPLGVISGTVVGLTSKKKHIINGDIKAFQKFTSKFID